MRKWIGRIRQKHLRTASTTNSTIQQPDIATTIQQQPDIPTSIQQPEIATAIQQPDLATPHRLCKYCQDFCQQARVLYMSQDEWISSAAREGQDEEFEHCSSIVELKEQVRNGCHLCVLLYGCISGDTISAIENHPSARNRSLSLKLHDVFKRRLSLSCTLTLQFSKGCPISGVRDLRILGDKDPSNDPILLDEKSNFLDARLSFSTQSPGVLRLARHWLTKCEEEHAECRTPKTRKHTLPTRLIDVEAMENSDLRLHIVDQKDEGPQYLTLSHCWGKLDILTLKSDNLLRMTRGIKMNDLPKTFQDSVEITRKLGFRYLWIDALCIIQDSVTDWKREASRMASVYENSACTIAALFGTNSHAGCFASRQPLEYFSCRLVQNDGFAMFATSPHAHEKIMDEYGERSGKDAPLHTRAWVVQERMMSPRTLQFGSTTLQWECRALKSHYRRIETDFGFHTTRSSTKQAFQALSSHLRPLEVVKDRIDFYKAWSTFLGHYTEGRLSHAGDRLVAQAGIVDAAQRSTGLSMVWGLWKELLPFELLWHRNYRGEKSHLIPPVPEKRAPSWSWASQDGPVEVHSVCSDDAPTIFVQSIECEENTDEVDDECNQNHHSVLRLSAPLLHAENASFDFFDRMGWSFSSSFPTSLDLQWNGRKGSMVFFTDQPETFGPMAQNANDISFLLIARDKYGVTDYGLGMQSTGTGTYRRIGTFINDRVNFGTPLFQELPTSQEVVIE